MRGAPCGAAPSHESQGPWPPQEAEFVSSRRVIFYPSESQHFHRDGFSRAALEEGQRNADGPTVRFMQRLPHRCRPALLQAVAEGEMLQASVDRRTQAFHGSRRFEPLESREEVAEGDLD